MRLCCFNFPRSRDANKSSDAGGADLFQASGNVRVFSYNELKSATTNFHPTNKIGGGGFGVVYKGILRDGTTVAIKSLSTESKQGVNEFLTEIGLLSNIKHPNLVQLVGCCIEGSHRILVYEYLDNNSLANALLGPKSRCIPLDWPRRRSICLGTAHGLSFLHEEAEPHIVHRDIKASNILLNLDLLPKIGDFGLAKLFPDNLTHISTRVAGTMGYLAPEYALLGQLTKKADIYSYGVLVLEIVSGRSSSNSIWGFNMKNLVEWTWELRDEDRLLDIVDPELEGCPEEEVLRFIKVALLCTQGASQQRPSMKQVISMLCDESPLDVRNLQQPRMVRRESNTTRSSDEGGVWRNSLIPSLAESSVSVGGNTSSTFASATDTYNRNEKYK